MKIIRLIARLNIGGPAIQAVLLTAALQGQGHVSLLAAGRPAPGEGDAEYLAEQAGVSIIRVQGLSRSVSPRQDLHAFLQIVQLLRRERPDIVHTHTAKAGALGRLAAWLCRVPAVHTFHGHVFQGYFSRGKTRLVIAVERMLAKRSAAIVAISETQKRDLCEVYRIAPAHKVRVVRLGFDLAPFAAAYAGRQTQPAPPALRCGWLGRLTAVKDPCMFPAIAWRLADARPAPSFTMIGDGELRAEVEAAAAGLGDRFTLAGWRRDMSAVYEGLDVLFLTSRNEGTPVAIIEAMAAGVAVIAADVGGVADLMGEFNARHGGYSVCEHGVLIHQRDPETFAAAFGMLAADPQLRSQLAAAAHEFAVTAFDRDRLVADIAALYADVLQRRSLPANARVHA